MPTLKINKPYPKQREFFDSRTRYTAYGGARGGGKSWSARAKAVLLAAQYESIQILILRRTFPELNENHALPLQRLLYGIATYNKTDKVFLFPNGSRIKLGYCGTETDVLQYQGQAYDVIFVDEATQFTEFQFTAFTEISRPSGMMKVKFSPRMYLTCNPGGVGHAWVKRLFVDNDYQNKELASDYKFIQAKVYDNDYIMKNDPDYVRMLENIPDENRREAMLNGNWDVFVGQYFTEFKRDIHVVEPFEVPDEWKRYTAMDYGLDMLAWYDIAIDFEGTCHIVNEIYKSELIVSDASEMMLEREPGRIEERIAPPDLWSRRPESGKSQADLFEENGITLTRCNNERIGGWLAVKELLKCRLLSDGKIKPKLQIFRSCSNLIRTLPLLQYDDKKINDISTEPHEITHAPDALRYFASYWTSAPKENIIKRVHYRKDELEDYYRANDKLRKQIVKDKGGYPQNDYR